MKLLKFIFIIILSFLLNYSVFSDAHEASFYKKGKDKRVTCELCPNRCELQEGQRGPCRVRENRGGILYTLVYGGIVTYHNDPIEKKPLYHYLPGTYSFSIATAGCNLHCLFCQNYTISQAAPEDLPVLKVTPSAIVKTAISEKSSSIAYTYNEPIIFYEFVYDIAQSARESGLKNILVTAGYINEEPLRKLFKVIDAANVDLKGFNREYYEKVVGGDLEIVKRTLKIMKEEGVWIEITTLIVPGMNDTDEEIREMCRWIKTELGEDVPLHFSRFHPMYKLKDLPPTPTETLERMRKIAVEEGLNYVYIGNVPGSKYSNTYCPNCGKLLISRFGYLISEMNISTEGKCKFCGHVIPGIWK
ncbi:MAG: AmmeMemoRadiSam system radical SAM enzyme [bacterium]|nr:AmmeMemoRadiSam system radical SAM enzyme [bacterium]